MSGMRYQLFDVDVTHPRHDLTLAPEVSGAAILARRAGVPIGFWMQRTKGARTISVEEFERGIRRHTIDTVVATSVAERSERPPLGQPLPFLTIAICTKDRPLGVERLLDSLREPTAAVPTQLDGLEILVVDNAPSNEQTRELVERRPEIRYVRERPPGLNFGRNRALREARGNVIAFLDDDVIVDTYWLSGIAAALAQHPDAAAFTGQVLPMELETDAQILFEDRGGFRRGFAQVRYGAVRRGNPVYPGSAGIFGTGANMAFKTDVVRRLGGFDEALDSGAPVPGGGDLDMFYRVIRAGHVLVYEPRYLVFHQHRRDLVGLISQYQRSWGLGLMCYVSKCLTTDPVQRPRLLLYILWWLFLHVGQVVVQSTRKLLGLPHRPPSIYFGEIWYGAKGLFGGYARSQRHVAALRQRFL